MHRHLNEELSPVSREEEPAGKVGAFSSGDGVFCSGMLSTIGSSGRLFPSLFGATPEVPESRGALKAKCSFPVHSSGEREGG